MTSLFHPMCQHLIAQLSECKGNTAMARQVNTAIRDGIQSIYTESNVTKMLEVCCALDTRFKSLPYHNDDEKACVYGLVIQIIIGSEREAIQVFKVECYNIILIQLFCSPETELKVLKLI